jgi:hypothetical protein
VPRQDDDKVTTREQVGSASEALPDFALRAEEMLKANASPESVDARLREDMQELLVAQSLGINPATAALHRYMPVEIYVPGEPEEASADLLGIVTELLYFAHDAEWEVHAAGPVRQGSLKLSAIFRTIRKLTLEESQAELDGLGQGAAEAIAEGAAGDAPPDPPKPPVPGGAGTPGAPGGAAGSGGGRAHVVGKFKAATASLLVALYAAPIGTTVQIATWRFEVPAQATIAVKQVPPSNVLFSIHLGAQRTLPGQPEKREPK